MFRAPGAASLSLGVLTFLFNVNAARAQVATTPPAHSLITQNIDERSLVKLNGQTHAEANHWTNPFPDPSVTTTYYHGDHLGSARLTTGADGYPTCSATFLPFGQEWNPQITVNHYKFTGKERDSESGLDNFGARYDSSQYGRFMTPDWSASPITVPYANFADPQTLNLYGYVRNNPLGRPDIDGHCFIFDVCIVDVVVAVAASGAINGAVIDSAGKPQDRPQLLPPPPPQPKPRPCGPSGMTTDAMWSCPAGTP
jgi:RHS repeat-associated protein